MVEVKEKERGTRTGALLKKRINMTMQRATLWQTGQQIKGRQLRNLLLIDMHDHHAGRARTRRPVIAHCGRKRGFFPGCRHNRKRRFLAGRLRGGEQGNIRRFSAQHLASRITP